MPELEISPEDRRDLDEKGTTVRYLRGNLLFGEGEETDFALLILAGYVKITVGSPDKIVGIRGPNEIVGEMAALDGQPRSAGVFALTDLEALVVPAPEWRKFLETHAAVALGLVRLLSSRLREAARKQIAQGNLAIERRLAMSLLELGKKIGVSTDAGVDVGITQNELAGLTGTSRETVSQIIGRLRERSIVDTGRQKITLCGITGLERIARGEESLPGGKPSGSGAKRNGEG